MRVFARMARLLPRRSVVLGALGAVTSACAASRPPAAAEARVAPAFAEIERRVGGRVGVFAVDTATGRQLAHRPDERFAMCSTFKWALAAAALAQVDRGALSLEAPVPYGPADLLTYAPVARDPANLARGAMTVEALARAAVRSEERRGGEESRSRGSPDH